MKIYNRDGWINWEYLCGLKKSFIMVVGPRGTRKTYGLMKYLIDKHKPFIYLRRLQSQMDICKTEAGNPFRKLNADYDYNISPKKRSKLAEFRSEGGEGYIVAIGVALSTVATIRGFDFSGYDYIVFDEAVPMTGEKPVKNEFEAFLNFYETVNRNRELQGSDAVKAMLLGNANQLVNPYYSGWKFTRTAIKMIRGHQMIYNTPDGSRCMVQLLDSPISKKKAETALYQNANNNFIAMAIDNTFRTDETMIGSKPLQEYNHIVSIGDIGIYKHKSKREYYVCGVTAKPYYDDYGMSLKLFRNDFCTLRIIYMMKKIFVFDTYETEILFRTYLKIE